MPRPHSHIIAVVLATWAVPGCADWPTFSHLPPISGAEPAQLTASTDSGGDTGGGAEVLWATAVAEAEDNSTYDLSLPNSLGLGEGFRIAGALAGAGWDHDATPPGAADTGCTADDLFPGTTGGYYAGDVDWVAVSPAPEGVLCVAMVLDGDQADSAFYDLTAWTEGACGLPGVPVYDTAGTGIAGQSSGGTFAAWSTPVSGGEVFGVMLAAFLPADLDFTPGYDLAISLIAADAHAGSGCPIHPRLQ